MLGVLGWVGSLRLQKQGYDHLFVLSKETHLINDKVPWQLFGWQNYGSMSNSPLIPPQKFLTNIPSRTWDLPNSPTFTSFYEKY
jgi:hypothetical protein